MGNNARVLEGEDPMGGINHQPCGRYLANSTRLSRALSLSLVHFNMANVALEHVILDELDEPVDGIQASEELAQIGRELANSQKHLSDMLDCINALRLQMDDEGYQDLPTLQHMNFVSLRNQFITAGMITDDAAWDEVTSVVQQGGFVAILTGFETKINMLHEILQELQNAVTSWIENTPANGRVMELEDNGKYNFKLEFARMYANFFHFSQFFLSSSLISTESWYRFNNTGTFLKKQLVLEMVA